MPPPPCGGPTASGLAAVVGHSQGEIAAACVAGALSLEDGARVVALRSRAITRIAGTGGMMSVPLSADDTRARMAPWADRLAVAAVNGPTSVVVSGEAGALDELHTALTGDGVRARKVNVDYGSHSAQVEAIRDTVLAALDGITPREADIPFRSSLTGDWLDTPGLGADYWYTNLRETVRFEDAVRGLIAAGHRTFIEVGPHPVLAVGLRDTLDAAGVDGAVLGSLRRDQGDLRQFLGALAEAHVHGVDVDFETVFDGTGATRTDLPTYPFEHQRYWPSMREAAAAGLAADGGLTADSVEARFWQTVEQEDLESLTDALDLPADAPLSRVLPALARLAARPPRAGHHRRMALRRRLHAAQPRPGHPHRNLAAARPRRRRRTHRRRRRGRRRAHRGRCPHGPPDHPARRRRRPHRTRRLSSTPTGTRDASTACSPCSPSTPATTPPTRPSRSDSPRPSPSYRHSATRASRHPCGARRAAPSPSAGPTPRRTPPRPSSGASAGSPPWSTPSAGAA
ncbi:acyltransferase domain-containing protein [Streptomyces lasalocidi]